MGIMKYQVFQDGKPADNIGYPDIKSWTNSKFETFEEAVLYALHWAYPQPIEELKDEVPYFIDRFKDGPVDCSTCECPVMMEIRKIDQDA
jgi:hypothetical protein